ncbi:pirin family protein [Gilvimarinus agarilyticus]|uniref:pirin family protein n=1 Tax=Gilvimarinus sp. 2_MG-2023 TaxID=3062666 RepID=UPI001C08262A|nr:pirin family protein [Gilvimarinus sp. 2_MG-2023]MBU2884320.1 pirin family protein [Gilvimarinus agarilyticus]MDO6569459.1 pirin family protein [Gilvimarinus sp. 2_MG-2023]
MSMEPKAASNQPSISSPAVQTVIQARQRPMEDLVVRQALPAAERCTIGPFVFFDHVGPNHFSPGSGLSVRPHPHIGLATLTYLYEGVIRHRDSLGFRQDIKPGAVNWMTAGRGIVHSERSPEERTETSHTLMGLQVWVALPQEAEQMAPSFVHFSAPSLPDKQQPGVTIKVIAGRCFGLTSPLVTQSPLFFVDIRLDAGASTTLEIDYPERAIYIVQGELSLSGNTYHEGQMLILQPDAEAKVTSHSEAVFVVVGGEPLAEPRYLWWNFVASDKKLIEQAKRDWQAGQLGHIPGDKESTPLPT